MYNHIKAIIKIYSHAEQYPKITYKMSLSLKKIVFIQGFYYRNNGAFFLNVEENNQLNDHCLP